MAMHALRASRALAGRGLLAQRVALSASVVPTRDHRPACPSSGVYTQSRSLSVPGWLWPFGGSEAAATETPAAPAVPVEPEPEPLEMVTGFTRDGAFVPVKPGAESVDFSATSQFAGDALSTNLEMFGLGSNWTPVGWIQQLYVGLLEHAHLPVVASLFCIVALLRLPSLPFYIQALKAGPKQMEMMKEIKQLEKDYEYYSSVGNTPEATKALHGFKKLRFQSLRSTIPLLMQTPIGFVFFAVRRMSWVDFSPLANGQFLWLTSLSSPDPYYLLPLCSSSLILYLVMSNKEAGASAIAQSSRRIFVYGSVGVSAIFFCFLPAASVMVFFMNSCITLAFNNFIRLKPVSNFFNIQMPVAPATPAVTAGSTAKKDANVDWFPTTASGIKKRLRQLEGGSGGIKGLPVVSDFMKEQKQNQFLRDHKATGAQQYSNYQNQIKLARQGKLKAFTDDPSAH